MVTFRDGVVAFGGLGVSVDARLYHSFVTPSREHHGANEQTSNSQGGEGGCGHCMGELGLDMPRYKSGGWRA